MKTLKVFISSPYTIGDVAANVRTQHDVFNNLIELGFNPFMTYNSEISEDADKELKI